MFYFEVSTTVNVGERGIYIPLCGNSLRAIRGVQMEETLQEGFYIESTIDISMNPRTAGIIIVKPIAANPNAQKGATQPPRSIHCDAKEYLNNVAMCLRTAKMFEVEKNRRWRCRDPSQVDVVRPFLEKLGLYNEVCPVQSRSTVTDV